MKNMILTAAAVASVAGVSAATVDVNAKLQSALIFRTGAELTQTAKVQLISGSNEVVLEGLSSVLDVNSITIKCSNNVTVTGFDYKNDYVKVKAKTEVVKKLRDSIDVYTYDLERMNLQVVTTNNTLQILRDNMNTLNNATASVSALDFPKLIDYYQTKAQELGVGIIDLNKKTQKCREKINALTRQLAQEEGTGSKPVGNLNIKVAAPLTGACDITVTYFTNFAFWTPLYDIQAVGSDKPLTLISKARFNQSTGIDWQKASITLSTATPSRGRIAPIINAWFIAPWSYAQVSQPASRAMAMMDMEMSEEVVVQNALSYKKSAALSAAGSGSVAAAKPIYVLDGNIITEAEFNTISPTMIESMEVLKDGAATSVYGSQALAGAIVITSKTNFVSESENESAETTYTLDLPYDLLANGSEHTVTLKTTEIPATFQYYCVPQLDRNVFLLASISNWSQYNLLPAQATITYDGTYAGKTTIDPNSTRPTLDLTLGEDKRVVVNREKVQDYSASKLIGSNKKQTYTYKLTVKNNKNVAIDMILKEQYPISTDKSITVDLGNISGAHNNPEVGSLTWEFPLAAGETRTFEVSYTITAPKDFVLRGR